MRGRIVAALLACGLLLAGGCSAREDEAAEATSPTASASASGSSASAAPSPDPSEATPSAPSSPASSAPPATGSAVSPAPAEAGGPAPTELVGVPVAAPEGYEVAALPAEFASQLAELARQSGQEVAALEAAGITDEQGNEAAVVLVTRYSSIDVTTPEFATQRRAQAETQGAVLTDEEIAGTATLTSEAPPLVSWTEGTDTLVVVSSAFGEMTLEQLRGVAAAILAAG